MYLYYILNIHIDVCWNTIIWRIWDERCFLLLLSCYMTVYVFIAPGYFFFILLLHWHTPELFCDFFISTWHSLHGQESRIDGFLWNWHLYMQIYIVDGRFSATFLSTHSYLHTFFMISFTIDMLFFYLYATRFDSLYSSPFLLSHFFSSYLCHI